MTIFLVVSTGSWLLAIVWAIAAFGWMGRIEIAHNKNLTEWREAGGRCDWATSNVCAARARYILSLYDVHSPIRWFKQWNTIEKDAVNYAYYHPVDIFANISPKE